MTGTRFERNVDTRRRRFLTHSLAVSGSVLSLPVSRAVWSQAAGLQVVRLSDRAAVVHGPDANVLAAVGDDGIVLIDGGHASWSGAALETITDMFPGTPVGALFNTHWHPEQTGLNQTLGERGVPIIAHENTRLWLGSEVWVRWSDLKYPPLPEAALPTTTFYESGSTRLAGRDIDYGYMLNAHTDGDCWVHFPDENVLVTGGLISNDGWPVIDWWTGGWIGGMLDGFDSLLEVADQNTTIIPANGPVMSRAELQAQQSMYLTIFDRIHEMLRQAKGTDEVLAARPTAEFDAEWGDPTQFVTLAFHSMWGHLRDAYSNRMGNIP